jgi:cytosine/adenosine deaminase-related metal-dependent hydrolase
MTSGSESILIRGGTVLTCDPKCPSALTGDVLVVDGRIRAVGSAVESDAGAEVIDARGRIVLPGLVDAHQHVWEAPYLLQGPDMNIKSYFSDFVPRVAPAVTPEGLLGDTRELAGTVLRAGTTTIFDWCHVTNTLEHAEASVEGLVQSGIRAIFGYGPPVAYGYYGSAKPHPIEMERFVEKHGLRVNALVGLAAALRGPDRSPPDVTRSDFERARALGLSISLHIGTHMFGGGGVAELHDAGLLGPDVQLVHMTDSTDVELKMAAGAGARVAVPPVADLTLGIGRPPLGRLASAGVEFGLGVDTVLASPPDMFAQMRAAIAVLRLGAEWEGNDPPAASSCEEVLRAATLGGARACWLEQETGSLAPGKAADIVIMRPSRGVTSLAEAYGQVVWLGDPARVELVMVAGRIRHHAADVAAAGAASAASHS